MQLRGPAGADFDLAVRDGEGALLGTSRSIGPRESVAVTVCGEARLRAIVIRDGRQGGRFDLIVRRP